MSFLAGMIAPVLLGGGTQGISSFLGAPQQIFNSITGTNNNQQQGQGQGQGQPSLGSDSTLLIVAGGIIVLIILMKK